MSLAEHLREFRNRLIISVIGVVVCAVVGWVFYHEIFAYLRAPIDAVQDQRGDALVELNLGGMTAPFALQLRVSLYVGLILSAPVWIWQIWAFLLPGLTRREKQISLGFFTAAVPLFFAGAALAAYMVPRTVTVLLGFTPDGAANLQDASSYLRFIIYFVLAFGLAFLLPVLMVALNAVNVLPVRTMVQGWRIALILILVFCAFITPDTSGWTMIALAIPVFALYWCAVGVSAVLERRRLKRRAEAEAAKPSPDEASVLPAPRQDL